MKKFKNLTLIFTSLLVLFLSVGSSKASSSTTSLQNKNIDYHLSSLAPDDIDDDYVGDDLQLCTQVVVGLISPFENNEAHRFYFQLNTPSVPFYLQVRNIRI